MCSGQLNHNKLRSQKNVTLQVKFDFYEVLLQLFDFEYHQTTIQDNVRHSHINRLFKTLLLGQALNTKHPKPQEEEEEEEEMSQSYSAPIESGEYKLVRCFQIPESVRCYKSSAGVAGEASNRCETVMARQCYLYTYIIHSPQPVH